MRQREEDDYSLNSWLYAYLSVSPSGKRNKAKPSTSRHSPKTVKMHNSPRSGETPAHLKYLPGSGEKKGAHPHTMAAQPSRIRVRQPAIALVAPLSHASPAPDSQR